MQQYIPQQTVESKNDEDDVRDVTPQLVSCLTKHKTLDNMSQRDMAHERDEEFLEKKKTAAVERSQVCQDAGFTRTAARGQFFVTRSAVELKRQGLTSSCRKSLILVPISENTEGKNREQYLDRTCSGGY